MNKPAEKQHKYQLEALPSPREVFDVTAENFAQKVTSTYSPAVLRGFAKHWPIVEAAGQSNNALVDYLSQFDKDQTLPVIVLPKETKGRMFYDAAMTGVNFQQTQGTLQQALANMQRYKSRLTSDSVCVQSARIKETLPGLASQLNNPLLPGNHPYIWVGNPITVAAHFDEAHNIAVVTAGKRRFTLFPPQQIRNLYIGPLDFTPAGQPISLVDLRAPDLHKYPKYPQAFSAGLSVELEPGDAIYIPSPWWHHVESISDINVLINYWWSSDYVTTAKPFPMLIHAIQALKSQPLDQQQAWQSMLEHYLLENDHDPARHIPPAARGILGDYTDLLSLKVHQWLAKLLS